MRSFMKEIVQEVIMKKSKGITLVEAIVVLFINAMLIMVITTSLHIFKKDYKNYSAGLISAHEALMFIDYYIKYVGEDFYIDEDKIYILSLEGEKCDYIAKKDNEIGIFYMNKDDGMGTAYTYQPILYNVSNFYVFQNKAILNVKIITNDGLEVKKTIGSY